MRSYRVGAHSLVRQSGRHPSTPITSTQRRRAGEDAAQAWTEPTDRQHTMSAIRPTQTNEPVLPRLTMFSRPPDSRSRTGRGERERGQMSFERAEGRLVSCRGLAFEPAHADSQRHLSTSRSQTATSGGSPSPTVPTRPVDRPGPPSSKKPSQQTVTRAWSTVGRPPAQLTRCRLVVVPWGEKAKVGERERAMRTARGPLGRGHGHADGDTRSARAHTHTHASHRVSPPGRTLESSGHCAPRGRMGRARKKETPKTSDQPRGRTRHTGRHAGRHGRAQYSTMGPSLFPACLLSVRQFHSSAL